MTRTIAVAPETTRAGRATAFSPTSRDLRSLLRPLSLVALLPTAPADVCHAPDQSCASGWRGGALRSCSNSCCRTGAASATSPAAEADEDGEHDQDGGSARHQAGQPPDREREYDRDEHADEPEQDHLARQPEEGQRGRAGEQDQADVHGPPAVGVGFHSGVCLPRIARGARARAAPTAPHRTGRSSCPAMLGSVVGGAHQVERDIRLVADDPGIVTRWNREHVSR